MAMYQTCKSCNHLITDDPHECPTPEYLRMRNDLIQAACEAQEQFSQDDLESYVGRGCRTPATQWPEI
jgi:hypothetical protein